ncbi:hypothetical protein AXX16_1097 [Serratia rubidaea]|nr:hypothetical protein AXX16_1097 [Serratia rubidaea]
MLRFFCDETRSYRALKRLFYRKHGEKNLDAIINWCDNF